MTLVDDLARIRALIPLLGTLTIRQAIDAGDAVVEACGLNPWCINEGRAEGHEPALWDWQRAGFLESLDRLRACLPEWHTIDTAPQDGTPVYVVDMFADKPVPVVAHWATHKAWDAEKPAWLIGHQWRPFAGLSMREVRSYAEIIGIMPSPTHWTPLPSLDTLTARLPKVSNCM